MLKSTIQKNFLNYFFAILLVIVASFFSFYSLGKVSLANWDEGIYANIVAEMDGFPSLLTTYNSEVWLEKPVFGFWLHLVGTNIFGLNNFGLRFVGALCFIGSVLLFYLILRKFYSIWISFFTALAFMICPLFYFTHMIRTADFDAYFLFFTLLAFWIYIVSWSKPKLFWLVGLVLGVNFMVRGYMAVLAIFVIAFHIILTKKYRVISFKQFVYCSLSFLSIVLPWHLYVLIVYPKEFIDSYLGYHFFKRIIIPLEGHVGNGWFYLNFIFYKINYFIILLFLSFDYFLWKLFKYNKEEDKFWLLWLLVFFVPLHFMGTKILWYMMGSIPAMFCLMASTCEDLFKSILNKSKIIITSCVLIVALAYCYFSLLGAFSYVIYPTILPVDTVINYMEKNKIEPKEFLIFSKVDAFNGPAINFWLKKNKNYNVSSFGDALELESYIKNSDDKNIILTDLEGYKKIKLLDIENEWIGTTLNYFENDWTENGVPVIFSKKQ